jgi:TonB family protein
MLLLTTVSSDSFARSKQEAKPSPINVASLLDEAGYKYVEVKEGLWRIPDLTYHGKNLKKVDVFLQRNPYNDSLRISLRIGFFPNSTEGAEFDKTLSDLNKRYDPTLFVLMRPGLFAMKEISINKIDREKLVEVIRGLADEADQAYPGLTKYMTAEAKPRQGVDRGESISVGPGSGGGVGVGPGRSGSDGTRMSDSVNLPPSPDTNVIRDVDSKPVILSRSRPEYTDEARNNNVQGAVRLRILVDETGTVKSVRVIRGLPYGLTQKAIEAGYKTRFKPAMKDGKAVPYWIIIEVTFAIR